MPTTNPASDPIYNLAVEIIPFILGEQMRTMEEMQAGSYILTDNQRKERLAEQVADKIRAVIPPPTLPPE